ncbi:homeobox protein NANOG [Huso huso]|uniref:Homeobox protein NANOG n=1 Tax=Huso huso TaxID=61971 RepID=A0ABR0Y5U5_HUSHU
MEEWKTNYIAPASSYHAYAYGLLYPDHQASHAGYWGPAGSGVVMEGGQHPGAVVPTVLNFSAPPGTRTPQPDLSPAYAGQKASSDSGDKEPRSPESWCSNGPDAPQSVQGLEESECSGSSLDAEPLSSTLQDGEEPRETPRLRLGGDGGPAPEGDLVNMAAAAAADEPKAKKAKPRTAFSQEQMQALQQRFQVQRYLTPVEMKTFAGMIGLTYKQVKTWFQNRRMKFKRHQKDSSWVSERYPNISANAPHPYQTPISPRTPEEGAAEYSPTCTATPAIPPHQRTVSSSSEEGWATLPSGGHGGLLRFDYSQQLQPPQFLYQPLEQKPKQFKLKSWC